MFTLETGLAAGKSGLRWWRADRASRLLFGDKTQPGKTILCLCFFPAIIRFPQVGWLHPALHPVFATSCTLNSFNTAFLFCITRNKSINYSYSVFRGFYYAASLFKPRNKEVVLSWVMRNKKPNGKTCLIIMIAFAWEVAWIWVYFSQCTLRFCGISGLKLHTVARAWIAV